VTNPNLRFCDKLLPDQPEHANLYSGKDFAESLYRTIAHASRIDNPHEEFKLTYTDMFRVEEMASNPVSLRFLQFLVTAIGARRVLEIGTFIGVSAMAFAKALPAGGEVVTIEKFDHFAAIAKKNFEANGLAGKIRLYQGDAFEIIDGLPKDKTFDLIFIDGNKERYKDYVLKTEPLLSEHGVMLVDDCFFHGDAINEPPESEKGAGVRAALDYAAARGDMVSIALPIANGLLMMTRSRN
jgi:predicted O-methyltransferase YrrM